MNKTQLKELIKKSHMKEGSTVPWLSQDKNTPEATLDALEAKLKSHNWFHYQSDGRVYDEGMAQKKEIQDMLKTLQDKGLGDAAKELYNKYAPYEEGGVNLRLKEEDMELEDDEDLTLTFKDENEFERAKEHFETNSEFYPEYISDEFRSFHFKVQDQADADSTEYYLTQELQGTTDLDGYEFALEPSTMKEAKKSFPDMTGDGKVTRKDILKARGVDLDEDLDLGHEDNEPHMLKADLYRIGKYAMELYQMVDEFEGKGEVDFPHWWQSKIINAKSNLVGAKHYLDFEIKEPAIDAMVGVASDEEILDDDSMMENIGEDAEEKRGFYVTMKPKDGSYGKATLTNLPNHTNQTYSGALRSIERLKDINGRKGKKYIYYVSDIDGNPASAPSEISTSMMENIGEDEILADKLYKLKNHIQPGFYQRIRNLINLGDIENAKFYLDRIQDYGDRKDTEFSKMKDELDSLGEGYYNLENTNEASNSMMENIGKYVVRPCSAKGTPFAVWKTSKGGENDKRIEGFKTEEDAKAFADKKNKAMNEAKNSVLSKLLGTKA